MENYNSSITPRLRVARNSYMNYERSVSQIATATEGVSNLAEFSQLNDLDLNEMASDATEQPSTSTIPGPSISARSENPAAVLRALLSRLPSEPKSPRPPQSPSQHYLSERESDYDMDLTEPANARSVVRSDLKDIFSKALRDPGDTPKRVRVRRGSNSNSNTPFFPAIAAHEDSKGKRRSMSDDEAESAPGLSQRPAMRVKHSPRPVTLEFLRERFSDSRLSNASGEDDAPFPSPHHENRSANISQESHSFQINIPVATSTPQQSLRMSVNSQFQSNLLDQDTEMQHAIDDLDSYGESFADREISPPPILRKRLTSRSDYSTPVAPYIHEDDSKTPTANLFEAHPRHDDKEISETNQSHDWGRSRFSRRSGNLQQPNFETSDDTTPRNDTKGLPSLQSKDESSRSDNLRSKENPSPSASFPKTAVATSLGHSFIERRSSDEDDDHGEARSPHTAGKQDSPYPDWNMSLPTRLSTPPSNLIPRLTNGRSPSKRLLHDQQEDYIQSDPSKHTVDYAPFSPDPSRVSSGPSRTSSLHAIDNTYHNNDSSFQPRSRSPSPPLSSSKTVLTSPSASSISKTTKFDIVTRNRTRGLSSFRDWANPASTWNLGIKSKPLTQTPPSLRSSSPWDSPLESDEATHNAQLSTHSKTFTTKNGVPADASNFEEEDRPMTTPHLSIDPVGSQMSIRKQTTMQNILLSPSAPPLRHTPQNHSKRNSLPSPPSGVPELPVPSSGDESERSGWTHEATPEFNIQANPNASSLPTPRPPGGWLQTPMPPAIRTGQNGLDEYQNEANQEVKVENESFDPKTPSRVARIPLTKTPKPPGAWQTPAPVSKAEHPASVQSKDQPQDIATPAPMVSNGSVLEPKTPYVPGGWAATPARKSLKVRFNHEDEDESFAPRPRSTDTYNAKQMNTAGPSTTYISPQSSFRQSQRPDIRTSNVYGRQKGEDGAGLRVSTPSRKALRLVDSMGHELQEPEHTIDEGYSDEDEDRSPSSRTELLSRIRRGLDNLVEDIDEIDREQETRLNDDTARMEELESLTIQARKNREQLLTQATNIRSNFRSDTFLPQSFSAKTFTSNRRLYTFMAIMQILLILLIYYFSIHRAREIFLNSYYDPFNPDLYLYIFKYDTPFQLSDADSGRTSPQTFGSALLQEGGRTWTSFQHLMGGLKIYFWKLWTFEAVSLQTTWVPT